MTGKLSGESREGRVRECLGDLWKGTASQH